MYDSSKSSDLLNELLLSRVKTSSLSKNNSSSKFIKTGNIYPVLTNQNPELEYQEFF